MISPSRTRRRLLPYFASIAVILPVYFGTSYFAGQPMLGVALAALSSLSVFILVRLFQLRGKLTLSLTVFGFPLLIALGFACFAALDPFFKLQRHANMLRDAGLTFRGRAPDELGEWKRTHDGVMLPTWLANRIGPDCMTKISSIHGDIGRLQSIPFRELGSSIRSLNLRRDERAPAVSPELVDWLNKLEEPRLFFSIDHYSDEDGKALSKLQHRYSNFSLSINNRTGDLSKLGRVSNLNLQGDVLTSVQAKQISALPSLYTLELNLIEHSADSLQALEIGSGYGNLRIKSGHLSDAAWNALAGVPCQGLDLQAIDLQNVPERTDESPRVPPVDVSGFAWRLTTSNSSTDKLRKAIRFFGRTHLRLNDPITEARVNELWGSNNLRFIQFRAPGSDTWKVVERPAAFD
ncbi:hypothetical protein [Planctomycetes bacterium K23_9]|uniref:Leucine Rich repeats (2 copies) n=1 Tax=Stieleria marina TaxID=1930275 RepID=A0A517NQB1_9BACT|nr:hypothetical protein K239x_12530 [Planctomycetes bacterium K23_9]